MKKVALVMLFIMIALVGCKSLDGTTLEDNEKVKKDQVVDMGGK